MKERVKLVLLTVVFPFIFVVAAAGAVWLDFHIWQLTHPGAPTWTFFFSH